MTRAYDVCIVGGGVVGLWVARHLARAGAACVLLERSKCGSGASGGILGALMAHAPDNWNVKKQFQFDALADLPNLIGELEAETGLSTGYAQCGRIMPVRTERFQKQAMVRSEASREHWKASERSYAFHLNGPDAVSSAMNPELAPLGMIQDTLAARVNPRHYVKALQFAVSRHARIIENCSLRSLEASSGQIKTSNAELELAAKHVVIAAGYESFPLLEPFLGRMIGGGVKGQAALFESPDLTDQPIIYDDGIYVVPHEDGKCAVGSTTEKQWSDPTSPDPERNDYIERAKQLCPPLRNARMLGRWAGVRPRCNRTDPIIGALDDDGRILVATGGYKITFGIAHRMAARIADEILNAPIKTELPPTFQPAHHLNESN